MRIGITGHQRLEDPASWAWVQHQVDQFLGTVMAPLVGISSLAAGADQLFAGLVLRHGGALEVVIPFANYERTLAEDRDRSEFARLFRLATRTETLEGHLTDQDAYVAAGNRVVDLSEMMVAVWDHKPPAGPGGTADAIKYCLQRRKRVVHLNPITKTRRELHV